MKTPTERASTHVLQSPRQSETGVPDFIGASLDIANSLGLGTIPIRSVCASAGLSIKPRSSVTKIDMLKEMMRAWGLQPEKILTREALAEPHRTYASPEEREKEEMRALGMALRDSLKKDVLASIARAPF